MTLEEFHALLVGTGFPVAYRQFKRAPKSIPYIVYYSDASDNFEADNQVFHEVENIMVELYTEQKEPAAEQKVKTLLSENGLPFERFESWIKEESLLLNSYETRFL